MTVLRDQPSVPDAIGSGSDAVLSIENGGLVRSGRALLAEIDWTVQAGERWVVLGPNGAGKTSLLRIASTYESLTTGRASILARRIGQVDVRELRRRIALVSTSLEEAIPARTRALDVVIMGRDARLLRWHEAYAPDDELRARELIARFGCSHVSDDAFGHLSQGERQRVQIARSMMTDPDLLLLDEPTSGLDVVGREVLLERLSDLAGSARPSGITLVTHHLEEVPAGFTHALLLREGRVVAKGPVEETLRSIPVSETFGAPLHVERRAGRFSVRLSPGH